MQAQTFRDHLRHGLRRQFGDRLRIKLLLKSGLELTGYARPMADWVELYKELPDNGVDTVAAFAHVAISDIAGFELIEL